MDMPAISRHLKQRIKKAFSDFPCVVLIGARQVGKSTLLKQVLPKAKFYDLERERDFQLIDNDPEFFLKNTETPVVIDEAQLSPKLFKALRVAIDENRSKNGRYLLSGSSSPHLLHEISESLAGRVAIINIPGLEWNEAFEQKASSFAKNIHNLDALSKLKTKLSFQQIMGLCLYGSYPEPFLSRQNTDKYRLWQESYIKTYIERDIRSLFPNLNLDAYKRFVSMLAFSSGEILNVSKLASSLNVSESTVKNYLEIVEGTFLWRKISSFQSNLKKRLIKSPKGYMRDTGLINYFLKIETVEQLQSHPNYGQIWESFVIEQILKSLDREQIRYDSYFYRSKNGAEVDLVIESSEGLIPIEIKSGSDLRAESLRSIKSFIEDYSCKHGIVINTGDRCQLIAENLIQVPVSFL